MLKHQKLIEKMTLEEKVELLNSVSKTSTEKNKRIGIPSAIFAGKECGVVAPETEDGVAPTTCFPEPETLARSWDTELAGKVAYCMGNEAAALGVSVLCTPDATPTAEPVYANGYKSLSEDPYLSGKLVASYVRGIQENDVAACVAIPSDKESAWVDERALREVYLQPYEMAVKEGGAKVIRTSDKLINGEAVSVSKHITRGIIRSEWQYSGVIVGEGKGVGRATERLINGNDLTLGTTGVSNSEVEMSRAIKKYELYQKAMGEGSVRRADYEKALDGGTVLDPERLDEATDRVIELIRTTHHEPTSERDTVYSAYPVRHKVVFNEKAHARVAAAAAESSAVLLKNSANTLPISKETKVAFIGEMIKRPFSQANTADKIVATGGESTLASISKSGLNSVGFAQGYGSGESEENIRALRDEAVALAAQAETVVVYLGIDENNKVLPLETGVCCLPGEQRMLLEAIHALGKRVVAVLIGTVSFDMHWDSLCDAVLLVGASGQAGTKAALRILSGEVSPSGKLARTIPDSCPLTKPILESGAEYRDSIFLGYRYYDKTGETVKYPFGFGLSYTSFRYSDIRVENAGVSFTLENTGAVAGAEVVQMYVGKTDSALPRAAKELKGFAKVYLEAGEARRVHIPFDSKTFRFYNIKARRFEIESGEYKIFIGASASDVRLDCAVSIGGVSADGIYKKEEIPSYFSGDLSGVSTDEFARLYNRSVRNGRFYNLKKKKKAPLKLLSFIPVAVAAVIDALVILSVFVPLIFADLHYILTDEEKFLCALGMVLVSGAAAFACVMFWRAIGKRKRLEAGDIALSQWSADRYAPDPVYPDDWKPVKFTLDTSSDDGEQVNDEEIDDIVRDRKSAMYVSLEAICQEYREYAKLRGLNVSSADARQIFAAISASRMLFIKNSDTLSAKRAIAVLGEFLQMKTSFASIGDKVDSLEALLVPSSASDLLSVIADKKTSSRAFCMSVLTDVKPEKMRAYFESFIPYISNPLKKCELGLGAALVEVADGETYASVALKNNIWFAAILADGASFAQIDKDIADSSVCIVTDITATEGEALSAETAQSGANTYYATVLEWSHRVDNLKEDFYLDENQWCAIDKIETYLAEHSDFDVSNKLVNRAERFAAVYLAMGGEDDCLDRCIASVILPTLAGADKSAMKSEDRGLKDVIDEALDLFESGKTHEMLAEFSIS